MDYEKLLSELDEKIRRSELNISQYALRERRIIHAWMFYAIPAYLVVVALYVVYIRSNSRDSWDLFFKKTLPTLITPIM